MASRKDSSCASREPRAPPDQGGRRTAARACRFIARRRTSTPRSSTTWPARRLRLPPRSRPICVRLAEDGRRRGSSSCRRQAGRRAWRQGWRQGRRLRSWRVHLSRPHQGPGRRCPRRRSELLIGCQRGPCDPGWNFHRAMRVASDPQAGASFRQSADSHPEKKKDKDNGTGKKRFSRRSPEPRRARQRIRRQAGRDQPRRQGGEGRPSLRLRRSRRRWRPEGPRWLRSRQGARSAGSHPQGYRSRQARSDLRPAARWPHAASRRSTAVTAPARCCCVRPRPVPVSSPVARCAPFSKRWAFTTSLPSRPVRRTRTTWFAQRSTP